MGTVNTAADTLAFYLSGGTVEGDMAVAQAAALGGYRSGVEVQQLVPRVDTERQIPNVAIDAVLGANGVGNGIIVATGVDALTWTGPGDTAGTAVTITNGQSKILESADDDLVVRVTRDSTTDLGGHMVLTLVKPYNSGLGLSDVTNAQRAAGVDTYEALFLYSPGGVDISSLVVKIGELGTSTTTSAAQLGASGAGTIQGAAGAFADWPTYGWAHIKTSGGTTREIIYYNSRSSVVLNVLAGGRARLGTSEDAGAASDVVHSVPGIRIAAETPGAGGDIQTIADENTSPTGRTWSTSTTTGVAVGTLNAGNGYQSGLWIHREIIAGTRRDPEAENKLNFTFTSGGTGYTGTISGLYRIENTALQRYMIWVGYDEEPDLSLAPDAYSTTLPWDYSVNDADPGTTQEIHAVVRQRNQYAIASLNTYSRLFLNDENGDEVVPPPSAPYSVSLTETYGGELLVSALYAPSGDTTQADTWQIYVAEGADPVPGVDTPTETTMVADSFFGTPRYRLDQRLGPYAIGSDIRVIVRTKDSVTSAVSTNTTAVTASVTLTNPDVPTHHDMFHATQNAETLPLPTVSDTVYVDQPNNIRFVLAAGSTSFYSGANLVWKIIYKGAGHADNGLWTTYGFVQTAQSDAAVDTVVDVVGVNEIYLTVNSVRRLKMDVSATQILCAALNQTPGDVATTNATDPAYDLTFDTALQVYSVEDGQYLTAASLDESGVLSLAVPWRQAALVGDIP